MVSQREGPRREVSQTQDRQLQQPLSGKSIVIVGGTGGIGLAAAQAILDAGGQVVAIGLADSLEAAREQLSPERSAVQSGDARDPATAADAIRLARQRFGSFDALYHVAGGSGRAAGDGPLHALTDQGLAATLELNYHSVVYSNRAAVQAFLEADRGGVVLNLTSVLASCPSPHFFATHAYASAKAAIVALTRAAASYYARQNIRFNALAASLVATGMSARAQADPTTMHYVRSRQRLDGGRIGTPADLAAAAVYFLSDQSRFVTGQVLGVDGGWSVSEGETPAGGTIGEGGGSEPEGA